MIYFGLSVIGCVTNGVFLASVIYQRHTLPVRLKIFASLTISGSIASWFGVVFSFIVMYYSTNRNIFVAFFILYYCTNLSCQLHWLAVAYERYIFIANPLHHNHLFSSTRICIIITFCYAISATFPVFLFIATDGINVTRIPEDFRFQDLCLYDEIMATIQCIPDAVVVVIYFRILVIAKKQRRQIAASNITQNRPSIRAIGILLITATYSAILSMIFLFVIYAKCRNLYLHPTFEYILLCSLVIIIDLHPIIYGLGDTNIRRAIVKCFTQHCVLCLNG